VLSAGEKEKIEASPTDNSEAYNYYLRGNDFYWRSYEEQDYSIAINMYQKSIELDPDFALAYVMLAKSHLALYWFHHDRSMDRLTWSKEALDAAFEIDPELADAYMTLGNYYYTGFLDYDKALEQLETAMSLRPNDPECIYIMACVYRRKGEWQEARDRFMQAVNADPRSDRVAHNAAETLFLLGEYDQAIDLINLAINLNPDFSNLYIMKMQAYLKWEGNTRNARKTMDEAALILSLTSDPEIIEKVVLLNVYEGKYQEAIDFLKGTNFEAVQPQFFYYPKSLLFAWIYDLMGEKTKAIHYYDLSRIALEERLSDYPDDSRLYSSLGISYAGLGQKAQAIRAGKKGVELLPVAKEAYRGVYRLGDLARIYVMVGEYGLALEQLDTLLSIPGILSAKLLQLDPIWKPLWDHPYFIRLMEKYAET
jgi:tetratricopeptide (TPR) repeat protein